MQNQNHHLALMVALATLAWTTPSKANETLYPTPPTNTNDYFNGAHSIEIYVPPPEEPVTPDFPSPNVPPLNANQNGICSQILEPNLKTIIGKYPNNWGLLVASISDGTVLYSHNADKYFIPASNTKLITTAAALQLLTPQSVIGKKTLLDWIKVTNQMSNNYYAETLLRRLGGSQAVKTALNKLGISPSSYRLADGSGLSRKNAATPRFFVELLRVMYFSPNHDLFYTSLPVAGISGTLRNRMRQTPAQGTVHAKTGTLNGVRALSGYINHPLYGPLAFSILANSPSQSGSTLVSSIDRIVLQLSTLPDCQSLGQ